MGQQPDLIDQVIGAGLLANPRRINLASGALSLQGEVTADGREVALQLVVDPGPLMRLPRFFVRPSDALGTLPHVNRDGFVCYASPEGLVLDRRRPLDVVSEALDQVKRVLTDGLSGRTQNDFVDELEAYWRFLPGAIWMRSLLEPGDEVCNVLVATDRDGRSERRYVIGTTDDLTAFRNGHASRNLTVHTALFLPLQPGTIVVPPPPDGPMWTPAEARRQLVAGLSATNRRRLLNLTQGRPDSRVDVVAKVPRPASGHALVGLRFAATTKVHPLLDGGSARRVVPIVFERMERSYLVPRGGGEERLASKRVLVVGGGAVGGRVSLELVRAGVLALTIVDADTLDADNTYRHVLGRRYWGSNKAEVLKQEIETQFPYATAAAINASIEEVMAGNRLDLRDFDLVVLATGNPTVELAINELLHAGDSPSASRGLRPRGRGPPAPRPRTRCR